MTSANFSSDQGFLLEILNGGAVTPSLIWLCLLTVYLMKEAKRRDLHGIGAWLHLPPSMNLILAIYVCDAGVTLRSMLMWWWRHSGAGELGAVKSWLMVGAVSLIVVGFLCKIRALTSPDYGDWPWLLSWATTLLTVGVVIFAK